MSKEQGHRIRQLERRLTVLEARIAELEKRPVARGPGRPRKDEKAPFNLADGAKVQ